MFRSGASFSAINILILGCAVAYPAAATAQRHGAGGSSIGGGINGSVSGSNRPTGVAEGDNLKDFHQVLAAQATSEQVAEFQALVKSTQSAQSQLQTLLEQLHNQNATDSAPRNALAPALQDAHTRTRKFEEGFSEAQKSGLKEIVKRLAKADSDLDQAEKKLDQSFDLKSPAPDLLAHAEALDKALTDFSHQQLALGREMSITLANAQDVAFTLPQVKTTVSFGRIGVPVPVSGVLSQIAAQGGQRKFQLVMVADLSQIQQNITDLMRAKLETASTCGEHVAVRQASLTPAAPASILTLWLHYERWICTGGPRTATELAEGDGKAEFKLTTALGQPNTDPPNTLKVAAAFGRIDASGMFGEALRSGSLGDDLRDQVAQSVQSAARAASDFKIALPPAIQNSAILQTARFQDQGVGGLIVVLEGRLDLSNEQTAQLASQLNQALSAQSAAPQAAAPDNAAPQTAPR